MSLNRTGLKRGAASPFASSDWVFSNGSRGIAHLAPANKYWRRQPRARQELAKFFGGRLVLGEDGFEQAQDAIALPPVGCQQAKASAIAAEPAERVARDHGWLGREILRLDGTEPGRV